VFASASQIVHSRFQAFGPGVKVHGRERVVVGVFLPQIQTLTLAHKRTTVSRHIDQ